VYEGRATPDGPEFSKVHFDSEPEALQDLAGVMAGIATFEHRSAIEAGLAWEDEEEGPDIEAALHRPEEAMTEEDFFVAQFIDDALNGPEIQEEELE
jgi:hypothetical protein